MILSGVLACRPACASPESDAALQSDLADWVSQWIAEGKYDLALGLMHLGVVMFPDNPNSHALRGQIYLRVGKGDKALEDYDRAVRMAPDDPLFHVGRGVVYADLGDLDAAMDDMNRAIELGTTDPEAYYYRGLHRLLRMRYADAERDFDETLSRQKAYADAYARRAFCRYMQGEFPAAQEDIEAYLKLRPDDADMMNLYGVVLSAQGDAEGGMKILQRALTADGDFSGVSINIGYALYQMGRADEALQYFQRALKIEPDNPYALCNVAELYLHDHRWSDAAPAVKNCVAMGRANLGFWRDLRRYLRGMQRAKALLEDGNTGGFDVNALMKEGDAAYEDGDYERAYEPYSLALILDFKRPDLLYRFARTSLYLEEPHHAAALLHQLLYFDPKDPLAKNAVVELKKIEQ